MFESCYRAGGSARCFEGVALDSTTAETLRTGNEGCVLLGWGSPEQAGHFARAVGGRWPELVLCGYEGELPPMLQVFRPGVPCEPVLLDGRTVGIRYSDSEADYVMLAGVLPSDLRAERAAQTTSAFENMERALQGAGFAFEHVVRTWLYMEDILAWYGEFNRARDAFFESRGVYDRMIPASTGIGSANVWGAAITTCAIAVKPKSKRVKIFSVDSPLQCPAVAYKSSFSRAAEVDTGDQRTLFVSGTASIEPGGETAFVGDIVKQTALTMEVIDAILHARDMDFSNVVQGVVYVKQPEFLATWQEWLRANSLEGIPITAMTADVCRDDLLIEIELMAVQVVG